MGTAQGGYGGGGYGSTFGNSGTGGQQSPYATTGYGTPGSSFGSYGGTMMGQQPAYGMGTGGQYSPQLRQAQTAWQQQAGYGGGGSNPNYDTGHFVEQTPEQIAQAKQQATDYWTKFYGAAENPYSNPDLATNWRGQVGDIAAGAPRSSPWSTRMPDASTQSPFYGLPQRQPYGMGAQGMGNAYGYGGQQGVGGQAYQPWGYMDPSQTGGQQNPQRYGGQQGNPWAQLLGMMGGQQQPQYGITAAGQQYGLGQAGTYNTPMNSQQTQGSTSFSPPPVSQPQAPLPAPRPAAPPPPAAPTRANYSPNNPFGGMYATPQGDAWEQQQRGGVPAPVAPTPAAPSPAAPGTDVMRKALAAGVPNQGTTNGYGYGTPGGYQLDTAPSTLDPGSMNALLGIMGGNINGVGYPTSAANYANWYQQTYGTQAPGGPRAYPF